MIEQPASQHYVDAPVLTEMDDVEHWSPEAARVRLAQLTRQLPFKVPGDAPFCGGASNDVWDLGEAFLKVCWRADRGRIVREARLGQVLPESIPHARVHAFGSTEELSWVLTQRLRGVAFDVVADDLPESVLRGLVRRMTSVLSEIHSWEPDSVTRALLLERPSVSDDSPLSMWASDLIPLPARYTSAMADLAKALPFVSQQLVDRVTDTIWMLTNSHDQANRADDDVVIHGDPSFGNWLVDDGHLTGLMDFEWARIGPRNLELVTPIFTAQRDAHDLVGPPRVPYLRWWHEDYPRLFDHPDLDHRLWLYELIFFLRAIIWWPPCEPESTLEAGHPLHALRRLLEGPLPR